MRSIIHSNKFFVRLFALFALILMLVSTQAAVKADNRHSEQIIFSGVGFFTTGPLTGSPFGFWVWCQNESSGNGLYGADKACSGAMYVYALGLTKGVFGFDGNGGVVENNDDTYTMHVHSADYLIDAFLRNAPGGVTHGPSNTVNVSFVAPGGSGTSATAVVNVTGQE